jgi:hypothetical protein
MRRYYKKERVKQETGNRNKKLLQRRQKQGPESSSNDAKADKAGRLENCRKRFREKPKD